MSGVAVGQWQKAVRDDSGLSSAARMLGLLASTWADFKTGRNVFVSQSTLARRSGRSVKTVRKAIAELIEGGWLELVENRAAQGKTNLYALRMKSDPTSADTHPRAPATPAHASKDPTPGSAGTYNQATDRSHNPSTHQAKADEPTSDPWAELDDDPFPNGSEVEKDPGDSAEDADLSEAPEPWLEGEGADADEGSALPRVSTFTGHRHSPRRENTYVPSWKRRG